MGALLNRKQVVWLLLVLACVLVLPACGENQRTPEENVEEDDGILTYAALNPVSKNIQRSVNLFNSSHEDVKIEILDYSDEGGLERLKTELVLGKVPDIMELHHFGKNTPKGAGLYPDYQFFSNLVPGLYSEASDEYWMPYQQMVQKGYLEDLWPYIENDPDLGSDGVLRPPLEASEIDGGLYILFDAAVIFTLTGRESEVGDRYSWTMEDIKEILAEMPEGSTVMRYNMTKRDAFFNLLQFSLDRFVDWETGTCHFDSDGFVDLVQFLETFSDEVDNTDPAEAEAEVIRRISEGKQMLEGRLIICQESMLYSDSLWQECAAFPGYPTADDSSGNFFYPMGKILAMSSTSRHKDAAWEYIRRLIQPQLTAKSDSIGYIQVNMHDFEINLRAEIEQQYEAARKVGLLDDPEGLKKNNGLVFSEYHFKYGPKLPLMSLLTEEDTQRYKDLIDHTTQLYWPNDALADIVWEALGPYFAGDWTLEHTIEMVQNRTQLYINEQQ